MVVVHPLPTTSETSTVGLATNSSESQILVTILKRVATSLPINSSLNSDVYQQVVLIIVQFIGFLILTLNRISLSMPKLTILGGP